MERIGKYLWIPVLLAGLAIAGCNNDDEEEDLRPANEVWMSTSAFIPGTLTVAQGTTVRWVNNSTVTHNVVSDAGLFNQLLEPGDGFTYTFSETGMFNYECTIHPGMTGTIEVQSADQGSGDGY